MRTEYVEFECDVCGKKAPARVVDTGSGEQHAQPVAWFVLEARHALRDEDRSPRLKADVCSVECGITQLERWSRGED